MSNMARDVEGVKNPNYKSGSRIKANHPCPQCGCNRNIEKRDADRVCKKCSYKNRRKHKDENSRKEANKERYKQKRRDLKDRIVRERGGKCEKCGGEYPSYVYDFHHIDPLTKSHNPAVFFRNNTIDKLYEELEKCIMVCANCHRTIHWEETHDNREALSYS